MRIISVLFAVIMLTFATTASANTEDVPTQCDITGDGLFSFSADVGNFVLAFKGIEVPERVTRAADLNHDGEITTVDFGILIEECPVGIKQ